MLWSTLRQFYYKAVIFHHTLLELFSLKEAEFINGYKRTKAALGRNPVI